MFKNKDEDEDEDDGMRTKSKRSGLYDTGYDDYKYVFYMICAYLPSTIRLRGICNSIFLTFFSIDIEKQKFHRPV